MTFGTGGSLDWEKQVVIRNGCQLGLIDIYNNLPSLAIHMTIWTPLTFRKYENGELKYITTRDILKCTCNLYN